ncbi:hypothetical protein [Leptolyngbya sp. FACHB-711]|uniref:hypothetical protein n=1 Tax=Leptolyngbya sp. FACHB-711 TaxID=2692813 RepID=UPI0016873FF1|nr:hypothetical protein [Leptolyngbya sp. FACHB-711]MBD1853033.1 hypothetical protein [Cyanobacteria bacterium FACHB-502]MBD2024624.1 hypothetical protein [Leptolyngbya sp. FACHB-711]
MKRSSLFGLSQIFGYAALTGVFIAQAAKPLLGVLSAPVSIGSGEILADGLRLIGLVLYFVIVVTIGEWIVKPLVVSPLTSQKIRLMQQLCASGWDRQHAGSLLAVWVYLSLTIGISVNLGLELAILSSVS